MSKVPTSFLSFSMIKNIISLDEDGLGEGCEEKKLFYKYGRGHLSLTSYDPCPLGNYCYSIVNIVDLNPKPHPKILPEIYIPNSDKSTLTTTVILGGFSYTYKYNIHKYLAP